MDIENSISVLSRLLLQIKVAEFENILNIPLIP